MPTFKFACKWAVSYELVSLYHILMTYKTFYVILSLNKYYKKVELKMSKIKKTDLNKLTKLEKQIIELTKEKEKQEKELANKLGAYFLEKLNIDEVESTEEVYTLIDNVVEKFNSNDLENEKFESQSNINKEQQSKNIMQNE